MGETRMITEQELKSAQGETVNIVLNEQVKSILLPLNAGELIGSRNLVIQTDGLSMIWNADKLKEIAAADSSGKGLILS